MKPMRLGVVAVAACVAVVAAPALAQTKRACANAYTEAQVLRAKQKLREAKTQLAICAEETCPQPLRRDCVPWLAEIDKALPSIVVRAKDAGGAAIEAARIAVDGEPMSAGAPARVDPGDHVVTVEANGFSSETQHLTLAAGETRTMDVALTAERAPIAEPEHPKAVVPVAPFVAAGIGLIGMGLFAGFGIAGNGIRSDLDAQACKPSCPGARVDAVKTDYVVADVALGVGLVALAVAVVLFVVSPWHEPRVSASAGSILVRF